MATLQRCPVLPGSPVRTTIVWRERVRARHGATRVHALREGGVVSGREDPWAHTAACRAGQPLRLPLRFHFSARTRIDSPGASPGSSLPYGAVTSPAITPADCFSISSTTEPSPPAVARLLTRLCAHSTLRGAQS